MSKAYRHVLQLKKTIAELVVKANTSEIVVEPHDQDFIEFSGTVIGGTASDVTFNYVEENNKLTVNVGVREGVEFLTVKLKLRIPVTHTIDYILLVSEGGDFRIDGLPFRTLYLYTAGGDVIARGVVGNALRIECVRGDILLSGGSIKDANLITINGKIKAECAIKDGILLAESVNGEVRLLLTEDSSALIEISTINGDIKVVSTEKLSAVIRHTKFAQYKVGEGVAKVVARSINGNLRIELLKKLPP